MAWNPSAHADKAKEQRDFDDRPPPNGEYDFGVVWWKRLSDKAVKLCVSVIHGPSKGRSAFVVMGTNMEKKGSADRMFWFCQATGIDGDLTFDDDDFNELFLGASLRARVRTTKKEGRDRTLYDSELVRVWPRNELSKGDIAVLEEWSAAYEQKKQDDAERRASGRGRDDDWGDRGGGYGSGSRNDDPPPDDSPDYTDDDIPF
jgi:hypothetical protein